VSTATMRLRRAGAGGLAAAVIAGTLVATGGLASAVATPAAGTYQLTTAGAGQTTIYPGLANQAAGDIEYWTTNGWTTGATATFTIAGNLCDTAAHLANAVSFSAAPTVTVSGPFVQATGAAGTATKPSPVSALSATSSSAQCTAAGIKDVVTVTFNSPASTTGATDVFAITLGGIKYTTGSTAVGNVNLGLAANGSLSAPAPASVSNATVANTKFVAASVVPVSGSAAVISGVALGTLTASDVNSHVINSPIKFTLAPAGAVFTAGSTPTLTGPSGTTWTYSALGANTLTATLATGTIPTTSANTFVLSGAKIDIPAAYVGPVTVTADFGGTVIGSAATVASVVNQSRVGGTDRYATAAALFNAKFPAHNATSVVLATGALFPDALSAGFLAAQQSTGILLTQPKVLPSITLNTMVTNPIGTVYIVGGPGAVSLAIENQIAALHVSNNSTGPFINVIRLGGADRYATNKIVNEHQFATHSTAVIATGAVFADALSVGPAVYNKQFPLLLTTPAALAPSAQQQLVDMGVTNVVIVGGTGAVSTAVETAIKGLGITITARLAGADRTLTAAAIATWETNAITTTPPGLAFSKATVHIATGADFPDALTAGPVAGTAPGAVILLAQSPTVLGPGAPAYLGKSTVGPFVTTLNALGLTGAVSPAVMNAAAVALAG